MIADELFANRKIPRRVAFTVSEVHTLIDMIARGLGIALVPQSISRKAIAADLAKLPLADKQSSPWTVSAAFLPGDRGTGLATDFLTPSSNRDRRTS